MFSKCSSFRYSRKKNVSRLVQRQLYFNYEDVNFLWNSVFRKQNYASSLSSLLQGSQGFSRLRFVYLLSSLSRYSKSWTAFRTCTPQPARGLGTACPGTRHFSGHWVQTPVLHPLLPFPTKSSLSVVDWLKGPCSWTGCISDLIFSRKEQNFAWCSHVFKHTRAFAEHTWLQVSKFLIFWKENQPIMTVLEK